MSMRTFIKKFKILSIQIPDRGEEPKELEEPKEPINKNITEKSLVSFYYYVFPEPDEDRYCMYCKQCHHKRLVSGSELRLNRNNSIWVICPNDDQHIRNHLTSNIGIPQHFIPTVPMPTSSVSLSNDSTATCKIYTEIGVKDV